MARERRHKSEPIAKRKRSTGVPSESPKPILLSRQIVESEPRELTVSSSFAEALSKRVSTDDSLTSPAFTQIVIPRSTPELLAEVASVWELHPVLVEDLFHANQRPKVDRYDDVLFVVLKSAVYVDSAEEVEFKEFHLLMKDDVLVIICQDDRFIDGSPIPQRVDDMDAYFSDEKRQWASDRELLSLGPEALVYRLLDTAVDTYFPVLDGLQDDKDGIERQVFSGDAAAAERIYLLSQEVIDVLHTTT